MLNGDGNENGKSINISNEQKKNNNNDNNFANAAQFFCTFLCRCFVRFQRKAIIKIALSQ